MLLFNLKWVGREIMVELLYWIGAYSKYSVSIHRSLRLLTITWPAMFSSKRYRVMATSGRPAGGGRTRSVAPSVEAFSLRSRIGTSRLVCSPHYRSVPMFRGVFLSSHHSILCLESAALIVCTVVLLCVFCSLLNLTVSHV